MACQRIFKQKTLEASDLFIFGQISQLSIIVCSVCISCFPFFLDWESTTQPHHPPFIQRTTIPIRPFLRDDLFEYEGIVWKRFQFIKTQTIPNRAQALHSTSYRLAGGSERQLHSFLRSAPESCHQKTSLKHPRSHHGSSQKES